MTFSAYVGPARGASCYALSAARPRGASHLRALLLTGTALLAGTSGVGAETLTWDNPNPKEQLWEVGTNWDSDRSPVAGDTANIGPGNVGVSSSVAAETVNLSSGILWINRNGVLNASTVNVSGGRFAVSAGDPIKGVQGTANISTLLNITGGTVERPGLIVVGAAGKVTQSGGVVQYPTQIQTPTYTQTGGTMVGVITADIYTHAGGTVGGIINAGTYELTVGNITSDGATIRATNFFMLAPTDGDATVDAYLTGTGKLVKSGDHTVVLTRGINDFTGGVLIEGGTLEVVDDALPDYAAVVIDDAAILRLTGLNNVNFRGTIAGEGGVVKTDGGTFGVGKDGAIGSLEVAGGTFRIGTANFDVGDGQGLGTSSDFSADAVALRDDDAAIEIEAGSSLSADTITVTAGSLRGDGTVESGDFTQSGGEVTGVAITTDTYVLSGGTLSADVAFSDLFSLSDDGIVTSSVELTAGDGATMLLTTETEATFWGSVSGDSALMVKEGSGTFVIAGDVTMGGLSVSEGTLNIGTGTTSNTASFDSAVIAKGATLYIAEGATLTVRIPKNILNNGNLINNGTVYDDLDNAGLFMNDGAYIANVATNTSIINNNTPGVWTGDVETNAGTINNNAGARWDGDIEANSGWINNSGIWNGDVITNVGNIRNYKTWTGDVLMNTYKDIYNIGAAATWTGDVDNNSQIVNEAGATWTGKVLANNNVVFNFENSFWVGDVVANGGGENGLAQIDNYGDWAGVVKTNAGWIFNLDGTWTGDIEANADGIFNNHLDSNRNPTGANAAAWVGNVVTNTGTIVNNVGGTWTGDVLANTGAIVNDGTWTGSFNNAGTVYAGGTITGDFINSGILRVTGDLSGIDALTNTGSIDLRGAGAAQTLMVDAVSFSSGSFFKIDVDDAGTSDSMVVAGTAQLAGTVRLAAASTPQVFGSRTDYTILTAGLISGTFDGVSEDYAFLDANLSYTSTAVNLALVRNDIGFVSAGTTSNQQGVAAVVEAFGAGDPLYDAIVQLNASGAAYAFDQLSGDAQTSIEVATLQGAGLFGDLGMGRIDASFEALDSGVAPSNYVEGPVATAPTDPGDNGLWGQVYGALGSLDAAGSTLVTSTGGVAGGLDGMLGDWRLGVMMQFGTTFSSVAARNTDSQSMDYGVGLYGGTKWGDTQLSLGGNFTRHDTESTRRVVIGGFSDTLTASYASGTSQVFGELSHEFDLGALSFTPFAGLNYVANATDAYTEAGGAAALSSSANVIDATFATLGVAVDRQFVVGEDMLLTAEASIGWRRAFADTPSSTHALAGGTSFEVLGAPITVDIVTVGAGLSLDINPQSLVNLSYDGQFGTGAQTHALKGTFANRY